MTAAAEAAVTPGPQIRWRAHHFPEVPMPEFRTPRAVDLLLLGLMAVCAVVAVRPASPPEAEPPEADRPGSGHVVLPDPEPEVRPAVLPDSAPADARLRREMARIAGALRSYRAREGVYGWDAMLASYLPPRGVGLTLDYDSAEWAASLWDRQTGRQCAMQVGQPASGALLPFVPLPANEVRCRRMLATARHGNFLEAPPTRFWEEGVATAQPADSTWAARLLSMRVRRWWGYERYGSATVFALRNGHGIVPEPDRDGPPRDTVWGEGVWLADAMVADVDRDGRREAVVRLVTNGNGSGSFNYLAVVRDAPGELVNGQVLFIGDRTILFGLRLRGGAIHADLVVQGEDDGRCCPTDTVRARFVVRGGELVDLDPEPRRRAG